MKKSWKKFLQFVEYVRIKNKKTTCDCKCKKLETMCAFPLVFFLISI